MKNAFKCAITTKLTFVHLFSFPLRKHLERFPSFAYAFASLSLDMRKRTHIHIILLSSQLSKSQKNCLVLLLQSLGSIVLYIVLLNTLFDRY